MSIASIPAPAWPRLAVIALLGGLAPTQFAHGGTLVRLHADGFEQPALTVAYPQSAYSFDLQRSIPAQAPLLSGPAESFQVQPPLPPGLLLDALTGVISGAAQTPQSPQLYRIEASGAGASAAVFLTIEVRDAVCGDGFRAGAEACDDGNISAGDGCTRTCSVEFGWSCGASSCSLDASLSAVGLGGYAGCILRTTGELGCFGRNDRGEAGPGPIGVEVHLPRRIPGVGTTSAVAVGEEHVCSLDSVGNVWCWGDNRNRQIGAAADGLAFTSTPLLVGALPTISFVAAGNDFNCAIDVVGSTRCWGNNDELQLGRGADAADSSVPVAVAMPDGLSAQALALGADHACALLSDATVACWGDDDRGQLGDGEAGIDSGVARRIAGLSDVQAIAAGRDSTCAVDTGGNLFCWGENTSGQLGIGTIGVNSNQPLPVPVALPAAVRALDLGIDFACAVLVNDEVYCWGDGIDFQLASGSIFDLSTPRAIEGRPPGPWRDITLGRRGACLLGDDGRRWCWGNGEEGVLGIAPREQLAPVDAQFSAPLRALALARPEYEGVICGVLVDGSVECAGNGTVVAPFSPEGALGLFEPVRSHIALPEPRALLADVQQMEIGDGFACVATSDEVLCWGDNSQLQLGQGGTNTADRLDPLPVIGLAAVDELALGEQHACARVGGTVRCWGTNLNLQTGQGGTTADQSLPVTVAGLADATGLALGRSHSCALRQTGGVACWGADAQGQLGDGDASSANTAVPVAVAGLPGPASQLVSGENHLCALVGGEVYCWGDALWGNLGQGDLLDSPSAVRVPGLEGVSKLVSGWNFTCALDEAGEMSCWGYALDGHLGDGGRQITGLNRQTSPVRFAQVDGPIEDAVAGNSMTCVKVAGTWRCLGFRHAGQLGDGSTLLPVQPWPMLFGP